MQVADDYDDRLRIAMLAYLEQLSPGGTVPVSAAQLAEFTFDNHRVGLLQHMRGIRVVSGLPAALTIRTTYRADPAAMPYEDAEGVDGYLRYKWRRTDGSAYDNVALRRAMELRKPLAWFYGVGPGLFMPIAPIWLIDEEPNQHQFVVAFDELTRAEWRPEVLEAPADFSLRRQYAEAVVHRRLHQPIFRQRVLAAYKSQCTICRLRHPELLDAAHIKEDADGGLPIVTNGMAMCAIHHRAFDNDVMGIRPDYTIEVREDILAEVDGPTLMHALQGVHRSRLVLPDQRAARPNPTFLEARYERFRATA